MSKEARVECLFSYHLEDLGIIMVKGQVLWFDKTTYDNSRSLKHATSVGAVDVQWKSRAKALREAQPPWLRRRGQRVPIKRPKRAPEEAARQVDLVPQPPTPVSVDTDRIRKEAVQAAREAATTAAAAAARAAVVEALAERKDNGGITQEQLEAALSQIQLQAPAPDAHFADLTRRLEELVGRLETPSVRSTPAPVAEKIEDDEPEEMFIPSGIVAKESKAEIKIESSASTDNDLDAAAAALKGKAPKRRRRKKKTDGDS